MANYFLLLIMIVLLILILCRIIAAGRIVIRITIMSRRSGCALHPAFVPDFATVGSRAEETREVSVRGRCLGNALQVLR